AVTVTRGWGDGPGRPKFYDHKVTDAYAYDALNRQTQAVADVSGMPLTSPPFTTEPLRQTTDYRYDRADDLLSVTRSGWQADAKTGARVPSQVVTSFAYDRLGRRTEQVEAWRSTAAGTEQSGTYGWVEDVSRRTQFRYDAANNLRSQRTDYADLPAQD